MFEKMKNALTPQKLTCTNCGKLIEEGEQFVATITMPSEMKMHVGRLDAVVAKTATQVLCKQCQ